MINVKITDLETGEVLVNKDTDFVFNVLNDVENDRAFTGTFIRRTCNRIPHMLVAVNEAWQRVSIAELRRHQEEQEAKHD